MVARLQNAGYLTRKYGLRQPASAFAYPVLGTVLAVPPQPASDEEFELLSVEELLIREPSKTAMRYVPRRFNLGRLTAGRRRRHCAAFVATHGRTSSPLKFVACYQRLPGSRPARFDRLTCNRRLSFGGPISACTDG